MRRSRRKGRRNYSFDAEELNPMESVSNLSDVMLILAVGIMLALILHWKVDIQTSDPQSVEDPSSNEVITFQDNDLEKKEELPDDMELTGEVYYDAETQTYYIVKSGAAGD